MNLSYVPVKWPTVANKKQVNVYSISYEWESFRYYFLKYDLHCVLEEKTRIITVLYQLAWSQSILVRI